MWGIFSFSGRASRFEWWTVSFLTSLVGQLAVVFGFIAWNPESILSQIGAVGLWLLALLTLEIHIAYCVKRLRDRGRSPWLLWLALVPVFGWIWLVFECGCLPAHDFRPHGPRKLSRKQVTAPEGADRPE